MRKGWLGLVALATLGSFGSASARIETITLAEGDIVLGNPATKAARGVSETVALGDSPTTALLPCSGDLTANGVDGIIFPVPEQAALQEAPARLTSTGDAALDVDVYWYSVDCTIIGAGEITDVDGSGMATALTLDETGNVPYDAAWGAIDLALGAQAYVKIVADIEVAD